LKEQQKPSPIILKKLKEINTSNELNIVIPTEQEDELTGEINQDKPDEVTKSENKILAEIWEELGEFNAGGLKFERMWSETNVNPILILTVNSNIYFSNSLNHLIYGEIINQNGWMEKAIQFTVSKKKEKLHLYYQINKLIDACSEIQEKIPGNSKGT
jgi:hypothetical protein